MSTSSIGQIRKDFDLRFAARLLSAKQSATLAKNEWQNFRVVLAFVRGKEENRRSRIPRSFVEASSAEVEGENAADPRFLPRHESVSRTNGRSIARSSRRTKRVFAF